MRCETCSGTGRVALGPVIGWTRERGTHATARDEYGPCGECGGSGNATDACVDCGEAITGGDICFDCAFGGDEAEDGGDEELPAGAE